MRILATTATTSDMDVPTAIAIIVLALIALAFWAGSEFELTRPHNLQVLDDVTRDRDAVAHAVGLLPDHGDQMRTEFVDALQARLHAELDQQDGAR